jgi:uncharacterized protein (UPF0548 family)
MSEHLTSQLSLADLTYHEVGATRSTLPPGYHHLRRSGVIGSGADAFEAASSALLAWQVQLRAGLRVTASEAIAQPGAIVLLSVRAGPRNAARRPLGRLIQGRVTERYMNAMAERRNR